MKKYLIGSLLALLTGVGSLLQKSDFTKARHNYRRRIRGW